MLTCNQASFTMLLNSEYYVKPIKKTIVIRPLPESQIRHFGQALVNHSWPEVFEPEDVNQKVQNFHETLRKWLDQYFPEKIVKISSLDKKWFNPQLKLLHRKVQREFIRHKKSIKFKKLKKKFRKLKRKAIKLFYSDFVTKLKQTNPSKWYGMAKQIGAIGQNISDHQIEIDCLQGLDDQASSEKIADFSAATSNEYVPIDPLQIPAYLPSLPPPQVDEFSVFMKLKKLKNTRSTYPIDIPNKLRNEFSPLLAGPLTNILNASLNQQTYPTMWKTEIVTPIPKVPHPTILKELRKICGTSDYSKTYESFIKQWIIEDVYPNIDPSQYRDEKGTFLFILLIGS